MRPYKLKLHRAFPLSSTLTLRENHLGSARRMEEPPALEMLLYLGEGKGPVLEAGRGAVHCPSTSNTAPQTDFDSLLQHRCAANSCLEAHHLQCSSASHSEHWNFLLLLIHPTRICLWGLDWSGHPSTLGRGCSKQGLPHSCASPAQLTPL